MSNTQPTTGSEPEVDTDDPTQRVHHHARLDGERSISGGSIITLCGLSLAGPRPGAAEMPCCPMCAMQMGSVGRTCDRG